VAALGGRWVACFDREGYKVGDRDVHRLGGHLRHVARLALLALDPLGQPLHVDRVRRRELRQIGERELLDRPDQERCACHALPPHRCTNSWLSSATRTKAMFSPHSAQSIFSRPVFLSYDTSWSASL